MQFKGVLLCEMEHFHSCAYPLGYHAYSCFSKTHCLHVQCLSSPRTVICSRTAQVQVQGLPTPNEKRSDVMSFHVMFIFYNNEGSSYRLIFFDFMLSD
jgi:hypothetical protein